MSKSSKYIIILTALFFVAFNYVSAQQQYYEITTHATESQVKTFKYGIIGRSKIKTVKNVTANLVTKNGNPSIALAFPGKTQQQLHQGILDFVNYMASKRYGYYLKCDSSSPFLTYRCFQNIASRDSCFADLVGLTYCRATPVNDTVYFEIGSSSKIYATIQKAVLNITPGDDVASVNDVGFNEYEYIQPSEEIYLSGGKNVFNPVKNASLKLAYPDSIFDPDGNVANPYNKRVIERYYDELVQWLTWYITTYVK